MLKIGKNLREQREGKKMTQKQLAKLLHVTPQTISKWELDKSYPDLDSLLKLSKLFDVSVDFLLGNQTKHFLQSIFKFRGKETFDMLLDKETLLTTHKPFLAEAYFITEMGRLDYAGSSLVNAALYGKQLHNDFETLEKNYPDFHWHNLTVDALYAQIEPHAEVILVISTKAKAYKQAIARRYPHAHIIAQL